MAYQYRQNEITGNGQPIALADAVALVPSLGQSIAHDSRSACYAHVTTADTLRVLESEGFQIRSIKRAIVRDASKVGFEKHRITLRHVNAAPVRGVIPEAILINSHDGSSAWALFAGFLRFVCENGLVAGDGINSVKLYHRGKALADQTGNAAARIAAMQTDLLGIVDAWSQRVLTADEIEAFAIQAHALRFQDAERAPVSPLALATVRRDEDSANDLWTVYNRIQESAIRGGLQGRVMGSNGRMRRATVRTVRGIDSEMSINRQLFNIARTFATDAELVAA